MVMDVQVTRELTCYLLRALRAGYRRARLINPRQHPTRTPPPLLSFSFISPAVTQEHPMTEQRLTLT